MIFYLPMKGEGPAFIAGSEDIPCRMEGNSVTPDPMESSWSTNDHISCFLDYFFDSKAVFNEPIYFFVPETFMLIEIEFEF